MCCFVLWFITLTLGAKWITLEMGAQVSWTDQMNNAENQKKESDNKCQEQKAGRASLREQSRVESNTSAGLSRTMESRGVAHRAVQMSAALGVT